MPGKCLANAWQMRLHIILASTSRRVYTMKKDIASTQSVNDPSRTIEEARLQLGMQPDEVADLVGLTKPNYYDLEAYDDEATSAISLGELLRLCKVLRIQPATLFDDDDPRAGEVAPEDRLPLSDKLKAHLQLTGTTLECFEDKVGFTVGGLLRQPDDWKSWNFDCLRSVCSALGVNWRSVFK